jgi:hypothetical protein
LAGAAAITFQIGSFPRAISSTLGCAARNNSRISGTVRHAGTGERGLEDGRRQRFALQKKLDVREILVVSPRHFRQHQSTVAGRNIFNLLNGKARRTRR